MPSGFPASKGVIERIAHEPRLPVVAGQGMTGAGIDTGGAISTQGFADWVIGWQFCVRQNSRYAYRRTELSGNQEGAFTDPAESGPGGGGLMRDGCGQG